MKSKLITIDYNEYLYMEKCTKAIEEALDKFSFVERSNLREMKTVTRLKSNKLFQILSQNESDVIIEIVEDN